MNTLDFVTYPETAARARVSIEHKRHARECGYDSDKYRACMYQMLRETINRELGCGGYVWSIDYAKA